MIPGSYNVRWCGGSRENIRSVRVAMKLARAKSSKRFATGTCGPASHVSRAITAKTAKVVAECQERSCTPFKPMSSRHTGRDWTRADDTAAYKRQHDLKGAKKRKGRR